MSPHSRSRSISPRRSYSKSPVRRNDKSRYSRERGYSHRPPSPPPLPTERNNGRNSNSKSSSSRSITPRRHHRYRHHRRPSRSHSRSRSRSATPARSRSRSVQDKRHGNRDIPTPSRCIGVFGMSVYTTQQKIRELFSKFGSIERIQVVVDAKTGRSRGFCFIYYDNIEDAKVAKDACCGMEIDYRRIRVAYSITQRPHTPTPGVYMGRSTGFHRYRDDSRSSHRRSNSPHNSYRGSERRRRYDHSRSRSHTPRRSRY